MKKICIQAGHAGLTSGATGAPNEREWNKKTASLLAEKLEASGYEVLVCDALANTNKAVTDVDWDLFLAIHYDADIYNDRGGFIDTPDQSVDYVTTESNRIASAVRSVYFIRTGVPERPKRSNANTKFYYMWNYLSANTPCVLIECGVGNRKPEDNTTLFNKQSIVVDAIVEGINTAFNQESPCDCDTLQKELDEMRESRNKWKTKYEDADKEHIKDLQAKIKHIEELQKTVAEQNSQIALNSGSQDADAKDIETLKGEIADYKDELKTLKDALDESSKENKRLADKLAGCQETEKKSLLEQILRLFKGGA
jgi:hypothetical protein